LRFDQPNFLLLVDQIINGNISPKDKIKAILCLKNYAQKQVNVSFNKNYAE